MRQTITRNFYLLVSFLFVTALTIGQTVTNGNDSGPGSLRQAIADANATLGPGTITFDSDFTVTLTSGQIEITEDITITGNGTGRTIIDGSGNSGRIFLVTAGTADTGSTISAITFTGAQTTGVTDGGSAIDSDGSASIAGYTLTVEDSEFVNGTTEADSSDGGGGAAIRSIATNLTINNSTFTNNDATAASGSGGAIFVRDSGILTITASSFSDNDAGRAGGAIEVSSPAGFSITNTTFNNNTATGTPGNGGALHVTGSADSTITGVTAINNVAGSEGGALWNGTGTMTVDASTIRGNDAQGASADNGGGGLFNNGGTLIVQNNSVIESNTATGLSGSGGGILTVADGNTTVNASSLTDNTAVRAGGAIESNGSGTVTLTNVTATGNSTGSAPGNGGVLHITGSGDSMITGGAYTNNTAANEGGALWNGTGTMTVSGTNISANTANGDDSGASGGGGIFNEGGALTTDATTTITGNLALVGSGSGGGLLIAGGSYTATGTTITGNEANRAGGGIEVRGAQADGSAATITLTNVVLNDNETGTTIASPGNGGGLHVSGDSDVIIDGGTINDNIAAKEGGGLWNNQGVLTISGTVISGNEAQGDFVPGAPGTLQIVGGGGIFAEEGAGSVIINEGTTISNNFATGTQGSGGGILMATGTTLTINGTEASPVIISGNAASRAGGGIEDWSLDTNANTLTNVTFTGNSAGIAIAGFTPDGLPGNGGAIHVTGPGNNSITGGSAISNSAANEGGAFWNGTGTMTIDGTVIGGVDAIAGNTAAGDGAANGGGGLFNLGGTLVISNATIATNSATGTSGSGGGILNTRGGTLNISDTSITDNTANRAGGGIEDNSTIMVDGATPTGAITLNNVTLDNNSTGNAPGNGGGMHLTGGANSTINGGTVSGNYAANEGGGLWNGSGIMTIQSDSSGNVAVIDGNEAAGDLVADPLEIKGGGGIFANDGAGQLIINEGTTISNNFATGTQGSGGGILMATGTSLTINGTTDNPVIISGNAASRAGGGIEDWSLDANTATLSNVNFDGNSAGVAITGFTPDGAPGNGGAIHVTGPGDVTITDGSATGNLAANEGGAFWNNSATMTIDGTTIDNNSAAGAMAANGGGGLFNLGGTLNVSNATITNNSATGASGSGGGILNTRGGLLDVSDSSITGNSANRAGGGIEDNSTIMVDGSTPVATILLTSVTLDNNTTGDSPGNGGGMHLTGAGASTISGGTVSGNFAANEGGGLWNGSGLMTIQTDINGVATIIDSNEAAGDFVADPLEIKGGGGIFANDGSGQLVIGEGTVISNNTATGTQGSGGGILLATGTTLTINGTQTNPVNISGNAASRAGGGLEDWSLGSTTTSLTFVNFSDNTTGVTSGTFTADGGPGNGGAIHVTGPGDVVIANGSATGNIAANEGGAFWNNSGIMTIDTYTIDSNSANGSAATNGGGGLFNNGNGTINLMNSTVSNNTIDGTDAQGGGIHNKSTSTLNVSQSTISNNTSAANGGGIYNNGTASLVGVTMSNNMASGLGGTISADSSISLFSTLIGFTSDASANSLAGTFVSNDFNLIANDPAGIFPAMSNDLINVDPILAALGDNGGSTQTHGFLAASPAIDAGSSDNSNSVDQIGQDVFNTSRDIGALEFQGTFGIDDFGNDLEDSVLFPNPSANGQISINIPSSVSNTISLRVVDMTGKQVYSLEADAGLINMDLSRLAVGTYLINLSDGQNERTLKLVLTR